MQGVDHLGLKVEDGAARCTALHVAVMDGVLHIVIHHPLDDEGIEHDAVDDGAALVCALGLAIVAGRVTGVACAFRCAGEGLYSGAISLCFMDGRRIVHFPDIPASSIV